MARERSGRLTEGLLSLSILLLVLLPAFALVYIGKLKTDVPPGAILLNDAAAKDYIDILGVDAEIAQRLVAYRSRHVRYESVDSLLSIPLFSKEEAEQLDDNITSAPFDWKTAYGSHFAAALKIPDSIAARLAISRDHALHSLPFSLHPSPQRLLRETTLLDYSQTRPKLRYFLIRRFDSVFFTFWIGAAVLMATAFLLPALLTARRKGDPFLIPLTFMLSGLGVVILFSVKDPLRDRPVYEHHLIGLIPCIIVMSLLAMQAAEVRAALKRYHYLWVAGAFILVAALFIFGSGPEGVKLNLFHFQPVEVIKLFLVFFLASYLADHADLIADTSRPWSSDSKFSIRLRALTLPRKSDLGPILVMYGVSLMLFLVIKDMGPGLLMFATFMTVLSLTTGRVSFIVSGILMILIGGLIGYWLKVGVFAVRVDMWLHPFVNSHSNGMQLAQSYWAMASGRMEGSGLGLGMPSTIPRSGSDLAFASWTEETGLIGAWLILLVFVILIWRGLKIALNAGSSFDRALAFGLTTLLGLQCLLIVAGVTGVFPLSGISLPFLSYGDSALLADFIIIGLLRGISAGTASESAKPILRREVISASRRFGIGFALLLLGGIGIWKLGSVLVMNADSIATRTIKTPDADGVSRPHINPRLLTMEHGIERGTIFDTAGRVLATSRYDELLKAGKDAEEAKHIADSRGRYYPFGPALAHLVGFRDPAVGGPFGMEKAYNGELRGYKTEADLLSDYHSRFWFGFHPRQGRNLHLTIDAVLQEQVQKLLYAGTARLKDKKNNNHIKDRAAFVIMNPETGDVLAAASIPTFDPNTLTPDMMKSYTTGEEAEYEHTMINRATAGRYPPGSTMKVATAASALEMLPNAESFSVPCNRVSPEIRWRANGSGYVRKNVRDDQGDPEFGNLTLSRAFTVSSNIYFANLAAHLDSTDFHDRLQSKFGFDHVPKQALFDADLPDIGFGQGKMAASPLEMCRLSATVANGGIVMKPRFLASISISPPAPNNGGGGSPSPHATDAQQSGTKLFPPVQKSRAMSAITASKVRKMMHNVVTSGTARGVFGDLPFAVAGKTGTAQNHQYDSEPHSWFIGFAPYTPNVTPGYALACVVENGGYGKTVAAVICHSVLKHLVNRRR